jgi:hypothetical protein
MEEGGLEQGPDPTDPGSASGGNLADDEGEILRGALFEDLTKQVDTGFPADKFAFYRERVDRGLRFRHVSSLTGFLSPGHPPLSSSPSPVALCVSVPLW